jgi:ribosomal protein S18 acetylase RimI-like enzyme
VKVQKLRHQRHADAEWFRDLDRRCFPHDEPFVNGPAYHWWIISAGPNFWVVGFAGLYVGTGNVAHFCRAGVDPKWRGMGFHRELIRARIAWCRRKGIKRIQTYAAPDNLRSIRNLKDYGFKSRAIQNGTWVRLWRDV